MSRRKSGWTGFAITCSLCTATTLLRSCTRLSRSYSLTWGTPRAGAKPNPGPLKEAREQVLAQKLLLSCDEELQKRTGPWIKDPPYSTMTSS
eukprot:XP_028334380.1 small integral membrane protein 29 isoform X4 [Physeter catodon]